MIDKTTTPYYQIPKPPENMNAVSIIIRLIDGLGFRFRWATEGLSEKNYCFTPGAGCMSIGELISHIWGLVNWVHLSIIGTGFQRPEDTALIRKSIFEILKSLRTRIESLQDPDLTEISIDNHPFWHIINGPLSDALTHVGQINSFRRLAGNPVPRVNVFAGKPIDV